MAAPAADEGDEALAARAAAGEGPAFQELVSRYQARVYRLACRLTGNEGEHRPLRRDGPLGRPAPAGDRRADGAGRGPARHGGAGVNQAAVTTLFGTWLFALGKALAHIRRREISLHGEWMIRAFSIGLGVATIRPIVGIFFATSRLSGPTPYEFFRTAFWIGWVLHLLAAEAWINFTRPAMTTPPV